MISSITWLFLYAKGIVASNSAFIKYLIITTIESVTFLTVLFRWGDKE